MEGIPRKEPHHEDIIALVPCIEAKTSKKTCIETSSDLQDATEAVKYLSGLKEQRALNEDEEAILAATKLKINAGQMHKALAKDILEAYQALERDLPKDAAMLVLA